MGKPIFLLGAGASMDAGLPSSNELTRDIYSQLLTQDKDDARLFGYVVAKIQAKSARSGKDPFGAVNVEDVYDALVSIFSRDENVLSEFVYSWDPIVEYRIKAKLDDYQLSTALSRLLDKRNIGSKDGFGSDLIEPVVKILSDAINPIEFNRDQLNYRNPFIKCLVRRIKQADYESEYIKEFVKYCSTNALAVGSLNYDLLIEKSSEKNGVLLDRGLSFWNSKRRIQFVRGMKYLKLHGSIDWKNTGDSISILSEREGHISPALIFGGQGAKLVPDGPFLSIRGKFSELLQSTNVFVVIGYSFNDAHLNAMIRSWVASRQNAKLIVVDPGKLNLGRRQIGDPYVADKEGKITRRRVEICHIQESARNGLHRMYDEIEKPPEP